MGLWMPLSYMMGMNNDRQRSMFIATSMNTHHVWSMIIEIAMITDRQWSLIITDIVIDQWLLLWNAVDHTWSVLINGLYHDPYLRPNVHMGPKIIIQWKGIQQIIYAVRIYYPVYYKCNVLYCIGRMWKGRKRLLWPLTGTTGTIST